MSASRDARTADIHELVPGLSEFELAEAVQLWCDWFGTTNSPLDASSGDWATFVAKLGRDGTSGAFVRV